MKSYLALGSNQGDRLANLRLARESLSQLTTAKVVSASLYETDPLDCPADSPPYLNTVVALETDQSATDLLLATQAIESHLGRESVATRGHHSPRPIDIDLLTYGDLIMDSPLLTLPHPRLHQRRFVLTPWRDLAPGLVPPTHANPVAILLELVESDELAPVRVREKW